MNTEINTRGAVRAKVSGFPSGNDAECLIKSEIVSTGVAKVNGDYEDYECPVIDDVLPNVITWEYTFLISPTSLNFGSTGGTQDVLVTSYKRKYINGNYVGVQENVDFGSSDSGNGFTSSGASVSAGNNTTISQRSGTVTFIQNESSNRGYVSCNQAAGTVTYKYIFDCHPIDIGSVGNFISETDGRVKSEYLRYINNFYNSKVNDVDWGFSNSSSGVPHDVLSLDVYDMSTHTQLLATFIFTKTSQTTFTIHCVRHNYDYESFTDDVEIYAIQKKSNDYCSITITISD